MTTIELDLHEDLVTLLREAKPGASLEQAALEAIVLELYRRRIMSSGKAAELLAMRLVDFIVYASRLGIPYLDMTEEEWEQEMRASDELLEWIQSRQSSPTPVR